MAATAGLTANVSVLVRFTSTATSGNAVIGASIERDDSGTDLDADSFDTEVTTTQATSGTSGAPATATITFAANADIDALVAGEQFRLKVRVLGANGSHTIGAAVQVMSVTIQEPGSAGSGGGSNTKCGSRVYKSADQTIPDTTTTTVTFDTESYDTDGFHSTVTNTGRLTIPGGKAGNYIVVANLAWASNATGYRIISINHFNSADTQLVQVLDSRSAVNGAGTRHTTSYNADFSDGDYVTMAVVQTSTGNLNVDYGSGFQATGFSIIRVAAA